MYVCICEQVTDKQIKSAIAAGATSLRHLREELGVASQCGQCGNCAKAIIKEHKPNNCIRLVASTPRPTTTAPLFSDAMVAAK